MDYLWVPFAVVAVALGVGWLLRDWGRFLGGLLILMTIGLMAAQILAS